MYEMNKNMASKTAHKQEEIRRDEALTDLDECRTAEKNKPHRNVTIAAIAALALVAVVLLILALR